MDYYDSIVPEDEIEVKLFFRHDHYVEENHRAIWSYSLEPLGTSVVSSHDGLVETARAAMKRHELVLPPGAEPGLLQANLLARGVTEDTYSGPDDEIRVRYGIDAANGAITFADSEADFEFQSTVGAVKWLNANGYLNGQFGVFIVSAPGGTGGPSFFSDLAGWLLDQGVDVGIEATRNFILFAFFGGLVRKFRRSRADKRMRKIAALWESRGLRYPAQLRFFFDVKSNWTVEEIAKRLTLSVVSSQQLLRALGYEENAAGQWAFGTTKRSKRLRKKWIANEVDAIYGFNGSIDDSPDGGRY